MSGEYKGKGLNFIPVDKIKYHETPFEVICAQSCINGHTLYVVYPLCIVFSSILHYVIFITFPYHVNRFILLSL